MTPKAVKENRIAVLRATDGVGARRGPAPLGAYAGESMKELLRSTDLVRLSWLGALLRDAGIESFVFDGHMSVVEGTLGILPRRLMVADDDVDRARSILIEGGEELPDE
ncbi:MAG: DUF2007 domain-containing protein [Dongiaceae bacterium]